MSAFELMHSLRRSVYILDVCKAVFGILSACATSMHGFMELSSFVGMS
jgi:hypothetical protein